MDISLERSKNWFEFSLDGERIEFSERCRWRCLKHTLLSWLATRAVAAARVRNGRYIVEYRLPVKIAGWCSLALGLFIAYAALHASSDQRVMAAFVGGTLFLISLYFFLGRKRRVAELFTELLERSLLPFPLLAAVDHYIMRVALSLDVDLAKFDQSHFHISMFSWLELQENERQSILHLASSRPSGVE